MKRRRTAYRLKLATANKKRKNTGMPKYIGILFAVALVLGICLPFRLIPRFLQEASTETEINMSEEVEAGYVTLEWVQTPKPTLTPQPKITPEVASAQKNMPEILIYHTHATEAYRMESGGEYVESSEWRTEDTSYSVIAVGNLLAEELKQKGYTVYHDTTNYEPPKLSTAYSRSVEGMKEYKEKHPKLRYYIDLHRDAYGSGSSGEKDYVLIDGKPCARMMFVVGTGEGALGGGFGEMPDYEENLSFAWQITEEIRKINPLFMRDVRVKTGRYNQHISNRCLLVEAGHNQSTLEQVKHSIPYLADAIDAVIKKDAG